MTIAHWNSRLETGIALINGQHQTLFATLNQLAEAFRTGTSEQVVKASLTTLMTYTLDHFQMEEQYMRERGYPELAAHQAEHAKLAQQTQELRDRQAQGKPMSMAVVIFLADLLTEHIHVFDLRMALFMQEADPS